MTTLVTFDVSLSPLFSEPVEDVSIYLISVTLVQLVLSVISNVSNNSWSCLRSPFSEGRYFRICQQPWNFFATFGVTLMRQGHSKLLYLATHKLCIACLPAFNSVVISGSQPPSLFLPLFQISVCGPNGENKACCCCCIKIIITIHLSKNDWFHRSCSS